MVDSGPSWGMLRERVQADRFTPEGTRALVDAISIVEELLGRSWPRRQFEDRGWWPGEFNLLGFHVAALPKFLALALQMKLAAEETTFAAVLKDVKRGVSDDGWRHLNLQLEVNRAMHRLQASSATFEPRIETSAKRADLRVRTSAAHEFLVEATTLARARTDLDEEQLTHAIWQSLVKIETQHDVRIDVRLADQTDQSQIGAWLQSIDGAAASMTRGASRSVESMVGRAEIWPSGLQPAHTSFKGTGRSRDGWYRLGRVAHGKAVQSAGHLPVWLRIDALDGFFQLTEWPNLKWPERIARVAGALRHDLTGFDHVAGVVLSSSAAVSLGATHAGAEDEAVKTSDGNGIRRLISAHVLRETVVVPLRKDVDRDVASWTIAYSDEPRWLSEDLTDASMPRLEDFHI